VVVQPHFTGEVHHHHHTETITIAILHIVELSPSPLDTLDRDKRDMLKEDKGPPRKEESPGHLERLQQNLEKRFDDKDMLQF